MDDQLVRFLESALVQQQRDPLSSGQLTRLVLSFDAGLTASFLRFEIATLKFLLSFVSIHGCGGSQRLQSQGRWAANS